MNRYILLTLFLLIVVACKNDTPVSIDVSHIAVELEVDRFDQKFYGATEETLPDLKRNYPFLFPEQNHDSVWIQRINDPQERELFQMVEVMFGDFSSEKKQLEGLFQRIKYHHPKFQEPKIMTLISDLDYDSKIIYTEALLFLSLDMFLGTNSEVYQSYPKYLSVNFKKELLPVAIAKAVSEYLLRSSNKRQFLTQIIDEGKKMYLIDQYVPGFSDAEKIGYESDKLKWVEENQSMIWKYFVENELLYSTDSQLKHRFILDAPFSKFYIDIDKNSPGKVGVWLGWQIVRSYMRNNNVTLQQLLQKEAEDIFNNSKFKPRK